MRLVLLSIMVTYWGIFEFPVFGTLCTRLFVQTQRMCCKGWKISKDLSVMHAFLNLTPWETCFVLVHGLARLIRVHC
mgnify:CR=1 FL=1